MTGKIHCHIIDYATGMVIGKPLLSSVPRVGDEIRTNLDTYLVVKLVVWVLDEPVERVNIGVEKAKVI